MSAHHDDDVGAATDGNAADTTLASLHRQGLIRSWHTDHDAYQVLVGRGTVRVAELDPAGVVDLAAALRRDRVTVVSRGYRVGHRITRYDLSDGRFTDRHDGRHGRYPDQFPYTVFLPGAHESGCAIEHVAAATLREAVVLAGVRHGQRRSARQCPGCLVMDPVQAGLGPVGDRDRRQDHP